MKAYEIKNLIERKFPPEIAEAWDNVGILLGSTQKEVKKVFLTLDLNHKTAQEAIDLSCDMIVSHHPIIFSPIQRITDETKEGEMLLKLIKADITVFAAHTNLDKGDGGLSDKLAEMFSLKNTETVIEGGLGRIGNIEPMTALEFAKKAKEILNTPVRLSGDKEKMISRVAVGSGASDDIIPKAKEMGADLVLTGDLKYHRAMEAVEMGVIVVDAGHYPTEIMCMDIFEELLDGTDLGIVKSKNTDIFEFI
ncbi:MAG: Nif3-like dinuclear metal center hexameric protein [Clostridia bacterium]|nr:Nif3-like dinuclear metal center hexameric protein [Clostridia bacterium]